MNFEFKPYSLDNLSKVSEQFSMKRKTILYAVNNKNIEDIVAELSCCDYNLEGFVIRDINNNMLKIKLPYYKFWKKVRSYLEKVINNKLNIDDVYTLKEDDKMKSVLRYAFDNYYSDMSLIDFRKEYEGE